jgi:flagellar biosynthesis component FlhA
MQALVACVRRDIPLILCGPHTTESRNFPAIQLSFDAAEQLLNFQADKHTDTESPRSIFIKEVKRLSESMPAKIPPVIITSDSQRERIWNLFRRVIEDITVLSTQEISVIRPEVLLTIDRELLQSSGVNAMSNDATEEIRVRKPR